MPTEKVIYARTDGRFQENQLSTLSYSWQDLRNLGSQYDFLRVVGPDSNGNTVAMTMENVSFT